MNKLSRRILSAKEEILPDLVIKNGKIVDVFCHKIIEGDVAITEGKIVGVGCYNKGETTIDAKGNYVLSSFYDTHLHFESTMMIPSTYLKLAAGKGVTMVNADPHEIANVCGVKGLEFMLNSSKGSKVTVNMMMPSCVPATPFDDGNAVLDSNVVMKMASTGNFFGLGEMMNYPGVISADSDVMKKLLAFPIIDGHAPSLTGNALNSYLTSGVRCDHECESIEEVYEKVSKGMYVMIREGSQTRNLKSLIKALNPHTLRRLMFCTDDKEVSDMMNHGTISNCVKMAIEEGVDPIDAITMATLNAYECFGFRTKGAIAPNFDADIIISKDLSCQDIKYVLNGGEIIAKDGIATFDFSHDFDDSLVRNTVHIKEVTEKDFHIDFNANIPVIEVMKDTVVTKKTFVENTTGLNLCANIERHKATGKIGKCFVKGFNLKGGAIAQTIGHDAHNITVMGDNEKDMAIAVNALGKSGGLVLVINGKVEKFVELPIAGLMTDVPAETLQKETHELLEKTKALDINQEHQPFMLLSFLSLIVIPELKITDRGLFDVTTFSFI